MSKDKALWNLTLLYTVSNLATRLINFGLVFVTTFYLTKEEVGDYDLFIVTLALVTPIATLQLQEAVLRWLLEDAAEKNAVRVFTNSTVLWFGSSLLMAIFWLGALYFQWYEFATSLFFLVVLQSGYILFQQAVRGLGNNRLFVSSSILYSFVYAVLAVLVLVFTDWKINGLILANLAGSVLTCFYLLWSGRLWHYFRWSALESGLSAALIRYALPLIPNTLSWWAIASVSRYFIIYFLGKAANGVFSIAQKIPTILLLFTGIFYQAWQEKSLSMVASRDESQYHSQVFKIYIRVLFTLAIGIVVSSKFLLRYLVSPDFFEAWKYTSLLIAGVIFNSLSSFHGTGYLSRKDTHGVLISSLAGGVLTILASWMFIPVWGLFGASLAIFLGYLLVFVIRNRDAMRYYQMQFPAYEFAAFSGLFLFSSLLAFFELTWVDGLNFVAAVGILWYINRKEIRQIFESRFFQPLRAKRL